MLLSKSPFFNALFEYPIVIVIFSRNLDAALQPLNTEGNVTRTGKSTSDLDKSDMVAMGYINRTMMDIVPEEEEEEDDDDGCRGRNVSFHQMITIQ